MTSKFNKEMYKKIKEKKNEPLSSIGQKKLRFTDKKREKEREKDGGKGFVHSYFGVGRSGGLARRVG